jgi:predicted ATPase/DNA-binding SARP family transcriptional activator
MQIAVLGPLEVHDDDGAPVEVGGARLRTLLILLALDPGRVVTSRRLIDQLWGDDPPSTAANALQALVSRLRKVLPEDVLQAASAGYRLAVEPSEVDADRFESMVFEGRALLSHDPDAGMAILTRADALWRGPALADADDHDFARAPRARLEELRLTAAEDRIRVALDRDAGSSAGLVTQLEPLVAASPLRESLVELFMRALHAAGRPADALAVFERTRAALADTLGTDPSPALSARHLAILRDEQKPPPGNLRAPLTSFVGRTDDLRRIEKVLGDKRLVTLIGPGGAGKTRLAVEAGRALRDRLPDFAADGVWLVELAAVSDPVEVEQAVSTALGVRDHARAMRAAFAGPTHRLVDALAGRRLVIVLDNCEHLVDASARLADQVLSACPDVRILATSREPLGITGEVLLPVDPLPDPEALRLLTDRRPVHFSGGTGGSRAEAGDEADLWRICRALDGMPLAIELAAARLSSLTPAQVADRLDDRFRLLTRGSRTALPRHRTLRAVVDWSWDLLDDDERRLLRRLSVFAGGATADAAARVCGLSPVDAMDGLAALADKSLLVPSGARFGMLDTIRAYAREKLAEAGESAEVGAAHTAHFLALAEESEPHIRRAEQLPWLARLAADHDNLNAAARRAITAADPRTANRFVAALGWYWWLRGHRAEISELAAEALRLPDAPNDETHALALTFTALVGFDSLSDIDELRRWFMLAIDTVDRLHLTHPLLLIARPLATLIFGGSPAEVIAQLQPAMSCDDPWTAAMARMVYGHTLLNSGNRQAECTEHFRLALHRFRTIGERFGMSMALTALGEIMGRRGDHHAAIPCLEEALQHQTELIAADDHPQTLIRLAVEVYILGDRARAGALLDEAQAIAERLGVADTVGWAVYSRARFASLEGARATARELYEKAEKLTSTQRVSPHFTAILHSGLGLSDVDAGNLPAARQHFVTALDAAASSFDAPIVGEVTVRLAALALAEDRPDAAAALLSTARATRGPDETLPEAALLEAEVARRLGAQPPPPTQDDEIDFPTILSHVRALAHLPPPNPD